MVETDAAEDKKLIWSSYNCLNWFSLLLFDWKNKKTNHIWCQKYKSSAGTSKEASAEVRCTDQKTTLECSVSSHIYCLCSLTERLRSILWDIWTPSGFSVDEKPQTDFNLLMMFLSTVSDLKKHQLVWSQHQCASHKVQELVMILVCFNKMCVCGYCCF